MHGCCPLSYDDLVTAASDLDEALADAHAAYTAARPISAELHRRASKVMPGGNTRTVLYHAPFPLRVVAANDAHVHDADGHEYVDLLGEYTAGLYGHSNPHIVTALHAAVDRGLSLGAHTVTEIDMAEMITDRFPAIDLVRFTNSGTEANLMAIALARVVTGRPAIAVAHGGYHGGLLYFGGGGSPINAPYDVIVLPYNDSAESARLIHEHGHRLAAVIVEPVMGSAGCIPPASMYLHDLLASTHDVGALFIADEVMTSRLSPRGACAMWGITPDLMTLGKYLGGGASFGAFGGRSDLMELFDPAAVNALPHAGTFNNNALSMSAGLAGLTQVLDSSAIDQLNARGDHLRRSLHEVVAPYGWYATGMGSMIGLHPVSGPVLSPADLVAADPRRRELLYLTLLDRGWYMAARGFIALSLAVTDDDVETFVVAVAEVMASLPALTVRD